MADAPKTFHWVELFGGPADGLKVGVAGPDVVVVLFESANGHPYYPTPNGMRSDIKFTPQRPWRYAYRRVGTSDRFNLDCVQRRHGSEVV